MSLPSAVAAAVSLAAQRNAVEPCVLAALVWQESTGDAHAIRSEPKYPWLWDVYNWKPFRRLTPTEAASSSPPADFRGPAGASVPTEWASQRMSWGACQVMGATARELGFRGRFLSELLEPEIGVEYGAKFLARLQSRFELPDALSAYNAGRPTPDNEEKYVRPILRQAAIYRNEGF